MNWKHVQPEVQIHSETSIVNLLFQITVRCSNDTDVRVYCSITADSFKFLFLKNA